ncbi:UNVERIFIED_CONTAM: hypothetical protein Sradi_3619900 [Sesamum radiatum]|uniref:Uncharacterized protein n=1 Tax=Sesamum radiatum TaxID=300843 RepID=A0AAW2QJ63_SESRA
MNSLSSLTHTTPPTHTSSNPSPTAVGTAEDGEGGSAEEETRRGDAPTAGDFNLTEFLSLANRVVDDGDVESWIALTELKRRWVGKFGDGAVTPPNGGLRPVATSPPTPFPPPAMHAPRPPRRA